ncbi:MAG: hypothetical protein M1G31_02365 [Pseudanabaena sp. Salubria-1]|nr:hypothetical protein [Pseudanabaena sp. Salubria-1]
MSNIQEIVVSKMQALSNKQQESVLLFIDWLLAPSGMMDAEKLEESLILGVESLDRGEGIVATDQWWEQERDRLINSSSNFVAQSS